MHFAAERAHGLAMPASNSGTFRMSMASPPGANAAGAHTGPLANTSGYTHTNWQPSPGLGMPGAGPGDSWAPLHPACNDIRFPQMGTNGAGAMWQVPYPNYPPAQYFQAAPPQDEMPVPREVRMQSMPPGPDRLGALAAVSAEMGGNGQAKGPVGGQSTDAGDVDRGAKGEEGDRVKEGQGAGENGSRRVSIEGNLASSRKRPLHEEGEDIDEGGRHRESTQLCDDGSKGVGKMGRRDEASRKGHEKGE
ncbi:hypothetical protein Naga_100287g4 [Nannochloropsis gaditana]|uniref:Uncharacterized protein n=2 Tax=Nannochloropsis gaditana TaxID=72520 RepID=W7TQS6_9STRA|nr:hypothetical protein Naga_100287g4 [Nannochloropsis gaditana]